MKTEEKRMHKKEKENNERERERERERQIIQSVHKIRAKIPVISCYCWYCNAEFGRIGYYNIINTIIILLQICRWHHFRTFHLIILMTHLILLILYIHDCNLLWSLTLTIDWIFSQLWLLIIRELFSIHIVTSSELSQLFLFSFSWRSGVISI